MLIILFLPIIAFLLFCLLGGFSKVYVSMCDFYGQPHLEEVVWVCTCYQSEQKKCLSYSEGEILFCVSKRHLQETPVYIFLVLTSVNV